MADETPEVPTEPVEPPVTVEVPPIMDWGTVPADPPAEPLPYTPGERGAEGG
ncbi:hypothetical protein BZZ08_03382 [Streptomyces sp. MH60]|nr:hypothetical protein BZZ08_03382 [Streptomyces sp. MH60]